MVVALGKVYIKRDQPNAALDLYKTYLEKYPGNTRLLTAIARVKEAMYQWAEAATLYQQVVCTRGSSGS